MKLGKDDLTSIQGLLTEHKAELVSAVNERLAGQEKRLRTAITRSEQRVRTDVQQGFAAQSRALDELKTLYVNRDEFEQLKSDVEDLRQELDTLKQHLAPS